MSHHSQPPKLQMPDGFVTIREAAEMLMADKRTVWKWVYDGLLPEAAIPGHPHRHAIELKALKRFARRRGLELTAILTGRSGLKAKFKNDGDA